VSIVLWLCVHCVVHKLCCVVCEFCSCVVCKLCCVVCELMASTGGSLCSL
jgi:hypothetical protein